MYIFSYFLMYLIRCGRHSNWGGRAAVGSASQLRQRVFHLCIGNLAWHGVLFLFIFLLVLVLLHLVRSKWKLITKIGCMGGRKERKLAQFYIHMNPAHERKQKACRREGMGRKEGYVLKNFICYELHQRAWQPAAARSFCCASCELLRKQNICSPQIW